MVAAEAMDSEGRLTPGAGIADCFCGLATCHTRRIAASFLVAYDIMDDKVLALARRGNIS